MSDFKRTWVAPVVTGALAAVVGGLLLAWFNLSSDVEPKNTPVSAEPQNELTRAAGHDHSDLIEKVEVRFEGLDDSSSSQSTGVPNLVFSFTNSSPKAARVAGSKGCDLVRWRYSRNGRTVEITKSAMLNQNGSSVISIPAQTTKQISYRVDLLDPPAYGSEKEASSVCGFWVGFGSSALLHEATTVADSPL